MLMTDKELIQKYDEIVANKNTKILEEDRLKSSKTLVLKNDHSGSIVTIVIIYVTSILGLFISVLALTLK